MPELPLDAILGAFALQAEAEEAFAELNRDLEVAKGIEILKGIAKLREGSDE